MATVTELNDELLKLSRALGNACNDLEAAAVKFAQDKNNYRKKQAQFYLLSEQKTIEAKKADVDSHVDTERSAAYLAEAARMACYERVKSLRAQLSALQTIAASSRVEMETLGAQDNLSQHVEPPDGDDFPF